MLIVNKNRNLFIDDAGNLMCGERLVNDPSTVDGSYEKGRTRKNVTGAQTTEFFGRGPTLQRITEPNGNVWWNCDDGTRLASVRDIDQVRREIAAKQPEPLL